MDKKIAGVVLAGGKSSRMGQNKALLDYNGSPLLDHMIGLLEQARLTDIYVSGDLEGYACIPDSAPDQGPAQAIVGVLKHLDNYDGVLFVPVDMPRLTPEILSALLSQPQSTHYATHPLPFYIMQKEEKENVTGGKERSVKALLESLAVVSADLPPEFEPCMTNTNTPEEWKEACSA